MSRLKWTPPVGEMKFDLKAGTLELTLSLLLAALAAGLVVAGLFRLLGLSIHYKLISGQLL